MNKRKIIIGIVGEISSGKTTLTNYLKTKYQADSARFSDCLRDILTRMHLPQTRENMQDISKALRQQFGQEIISKIITKDISGKKSNLVITEGIRRPKDTSFLKKTYPDNFYIIFIKTNNRSRYERLTQRSENPDDQTKTWEQFQAECQREAENEILDIAKQADYVITNNDSQQDLFTQADEIIKKIQYAN
ncbi:MAG: AAA family ATPase [bacterium]